MLTLYILGAVFIVGLAEVLGRLSKGKKLFEVLFFMISYANINGIVFVDYFGGWQHVQFYIPLMILLIIMLLSSGFLMRSYELKK